MHNVTVYLGSSGHARDIFRQDAVTLGRSIGARGMHLIYGGMDAGLMGILAKNTLDAGAEVTGIIPRKIQDSERMLKGLTATLLVEELCDRKRLMFEKADAIITLPGGFGTVDEALEALYWAQKGLHNKPILFVNTDGYWNDLLHYLEQLPDFSKPHCLVCDRADQAIDTLKSWEALHPINTPAHMPHFEDDIRRDTDQPIIIDKASVKNTYFAISALGLKQLGKHSRPIGVLNPDGQFDGLLRWMKTAAQETFITEKCLKLYSAAKTIEDLHFLLSQQSTAPIDLHKEKWGKSEV